MYSNFFFMFYIAEVLASILQSSTQLTILGCKNIPLMRPLSYIVSYYVQILDHILTIFFIVIMLFQRFSCFSLMLYCINVLRILLKTL